MASKGRKSDKKGKRRLNKQGSSFVCGFNATRRWFNSRSSDDTKIKELFEKVKKIPINEKLRKH